MNTIRVRQGKRNFWRWYVYKNGDYKCGSSIVGFETRQEAERDAIEVFGDSVNIVTDIGQQYAGQRDFSD